MLSFLGYRDQQRPIDLPLAGKRHESERQRPITGSQSNVLTISSALFSDAGPYQVIVSKRFRGVTSSVATLTVVTQVTESVTWPPQPALPTARL